MNLLTKTKLHRWFLPRLFLAISAFAASLLPLAHPAVGQTPTVAPRKVDLPADPDTVVIRLDVRFPTSSAIASVVSAADKQTEQDQNSESQNGDDTTKTDTTKSEGNETKSGAKGNTEDQTNGNNGTTLLDLSKQVEKNDGLSGSQNQNDTSGSGSKKTGTTFSNEIGFQDDKKQGLATLPRQTYVRFQPEDPMIEIYADGRVECGRLSIGANRATSNLSPDQLQDLMNFVVNDQKFFEIDEAVVADKIKNDPRVRNSSERALPQFTLTVTTKDQQKQVTIEGLRVFSKILSEFGMLQNAAEIERRLNNLFITINVGGREAMISILDQVNKQFERNIEKVGAFTINDATFLVVRNDGSMKVTFGRSKTSEEGGYVYRYIATYSKSEKGSKVTLYGFGD